MDKRTIYDADKNGFTVDGFFIGKKATPERFTHPGPLPVMETKTVRLRSGAMNDTRSSNAPPVSVVRSLATLGNQEAMRRYYGSETDGGNNDGARITYAEKHNVEENITKPHALTAEYIAEMHGQETLRRIRGEQCAK